MFALFNLGLQELVILAVLGFLLLAIPVTIILVVALSRRRPDREE
jgi:hypothetical protein